MGEKGQWEVIERLRGGLVVSCQAPEGSPLARPEVLAAMAAAAVEGGAVGIRADSPTHIAAIRRVVSVPIIGIYKQGERSPDRVYITPTFEAAQAIAEAGADIIALDATPRARPAGLTAGELIQRIHEELGLPVMADVSTCQEGVEAASAGADLVATTLAGYTPYSRQLEDWDRELLRELKAAIEAPVVVEGRVHSPQDACEALAMGAYAVVVGTAITRPDWLTAQYVAAMREVA
ncbi:MAG TPA: N-acetylmannosamine-6-phosphate 2-epimerase [Caldilineae bacterium]|nr:N-acetylmannosamine-6-phosphate 2-epimerase [Caldilineae bacterium]